MNIKPVTSNDEFDEMTIMWRGLNVYDFGPLQDLEDEDAECVVLVAVVDNQCVAYLIADSDELWHIETMSGFGGNGYAKALISQAGITYAWEVCTDEGAALMDSLGIDFDDAR